MSQIAIPVLPMIGLLPWMMKWLVPGQVNLKWATQAIPFYADNEAAHVFLTLRI